MLPTQTLANIAKVIAEVIANEYRSSLSVPLHLGTLNDVLVTIQCNLQVTLNKKYAYGTGLGMYFVFIANTLLKSQN